MSDPSPYALHLEHRCGRVSAARWHAATVLLLLLMLSTPGNAARDSLRCQGRLVEIGDTPQEVRDTCGPPQHIQKEEIHPDTWISRYYDYEQERYRAPYLIKGPIRREIWTYDFGSNRLPYHLHFENERLIRIESGRRNP